MFSKNQTNNFDENIVEKLKAGLYVFKVVSLQNAAETIVSMVSTYKDYERKLCSHSYTPLLYLVDIRKRIAYLYGCLNRFPNTKRVETFKVFWREVGKDEWNEWFVIEPYEDEII